MIQHHIVKLQTCVRWQQDLHYCSCCIQARVEVLTLCRQCFDAHHSDRHSEQSQQDKAELCDAGISPSGIRPFMASVDAVQVRVSTC